MNKTQIYQNDFNHYFTLSTRFSDDWVKVPDEFLSPIKAPPPASKPLFQVGDYVTITNYPSVYKINSVESYYNWRHCFYYVSDAFNEQERFAVVESSLKKVEILEEDLWE